MEADSIWLDRLPFDVCIRIAKCAESSNHQSAIQLAVASPTQRAALLRAVKHKLSFPKIARQGFGDIINIQIQDSSESGSDNERESASDTTAGSGSNSSARTTSDLKSESCCHRDLENCSDDEQDDQVCHDTDGHSDDTNCSDHDVETCSGRGTEDGNPDRETDSRSHSENENESDNANLTASGIERADGFSDDQDRICSQDDVERCSDDGTDGGNTDHETDGRSGDENEDAHESDNANVSASGSETGNNSSGGESGVPDEDEQIAKYVVRCFQRDYANLLCEGVREIVIDGDAEDIFDEPQIQSCLTSSSLLKLCLHLLPADTQSVQYGCNIRSLELLLLEDYDILALLRGFSSLQLRELKVLTAGENCFHAHLSDDPEGHKLLPELFPQLERLDLACALCGETEGETPWYLWNVIEKFSKLKEVTLRERVPDSAIERLREMERVTLVAGDIRNIVENVPDRVTSISTSRLWAKLFTRRPISCEHAFEMFANCVQLEELNCVIRQGTECGLMSIAGSLRSLGLAFAQVERGEDSWGKPPVPLKPKEGALLEIVKSAPFLKSVHLVNMRVQRDELREMLIAGGTRLEEFEEEVFVEKWAEQYCSYGGTFLFQKKDNKLEMEELAKTLRTAALNNPKLKTFNLDVRAGWFTDMRAVLSTLPKLRASFEVLQRRAVSLNARSLKELVLKFETGCFGMIDLMMSLRPTGIAIVAAPFLEL